MMLHIMENSCVYFVINSNCVANCIHVKYVSHGNCYSDIGFTLGKKTEIFISPVCFSKGPILHELMHSLGFLHEHVRPSRDKHITVFPKNVLPSNIQNFEIKHNQSDAEILTEFDFFSIMMYTPHQGATLSLGPAIQEKKPFFFFSSYNKRKKLDSHLSPKDIEGLNILYKCDKMNQILVFKKRKFLKMFLFKNVYNLECFF